MSFSCPHCSQGIEGIVKQEVMTERLKSQREALEGKIAEAVTNVETAYQTKLTEVEAARESLNNEFSTYKEYQTRAEALRTSGISADKHETFFVLYDASQAGKVNGDAVSFADWLQSDALGHPVLGSHFATKQTTEVQAAAPESAVPAAPKSLPHLAGAVAAPPDPSRKRSPQEIAAYFRSDKYRSLNPEQRKAEKARIMEEVG